MVPREGGMMLYKRLVRDQDESKVHQIRNVIHSSERERQRALHVLGIISKEKSRQCKEEKNAFDKKKSAPKTNTTRSITNKAHIFQVKSPYMSKNASITLERDKKRRRIKRFSDFKLIPTNEKSSRVVVPDDYVWHPIFHNIRGKSLVSSRNKRKNVRLSRLDNSMIF
jgi:hypothetical protein